MTQCGFKSRQFATNPMADSTVEIGMVVNLDARNWHVTFQKI